MADPGQGEATISVAWLGVDKAINNVNHSITKCVGGKRTTYIIKLILRALEGSLVIWTSVLLAETQAHCESHLPLS